MRGSGIGLQRLLLRFGRIIHTPGDTPEQARTRHVKESTPLPLQGLNATTNCTFDENGKETNGTGPPPLPARNELARRLFNEGAISPEDDWTFALIPQEILGVPAATPIGTQELDLSEIQDVVLSMEYDITPGV